VDCVDVAGGLHKCSRSQKRERRIFNIRTNRTGFRTTPDIIGSRLSFCNTMLDRCGLKNKGKRIHSSSDDIARVDCLGEGFVNCTLLDSSNCSEQVIWNLSIKKVKPQD